MADSVNIRRLAERIIGRHSEMLRVIGDAQCGTPLPEPEGVTLARAVLGELLPERQQAAEILRERARQEATRAAGADDEGEYEIATHFRYAARVLRDIAGEFDARVGVEPQKEPGA